MTFGEKIKKIRKEKKLSQQQLGEIMGVTQQTVAQYEKAIEQPKLATVYKIAVALGVNYKTLVDIDTFDTPEEIGKATVDFWNALKQHDIDRHNKDIERERLEQYNKLSPFGKAFLDDIISVMLTFTPFIKDYDEDADLREARESLKKDGYSDEEIDENFPIKKPIISEE